VRAPPTSALLVRTLLVCAALAVQGHAPKAAAEAPGTTVLTGRHVRLTCHWPDAREAPQALEAAEGAWPHAVALFGEPKEPYRPPLDVHLYRTVADYEAADRALTNGAFRQNLAFTHHATGSAHVSVQPEVSDTTLRALGLPRLTLRLLAHETCHVVRFAALRAFRAHPRWVGDGAALWVASKVLREQGWSEGLEEDPLEATSLAQAQRAAARMGASFASRVLADDVDDLAFYERYAVRRALFTWLAEGPRKEALPAFFASFRALDVEQGLADRAREALRAALGSEGAAALPAEVSAWLAALEPRWEEVYRSLEVRGTEWPQLAFADTNAIAWRRDALPGRFRLSGSVEVLPARAHQANLLFARSGEDFLSVALVAGAGGGGNAVLFRYTSRDDAWQRLADSPTSLAIGRRAAFELLVEGGFVVFRLDGAELLRWPHGDRDLSGPYGVGAQAGSAVVWSSVSGVARD
jgi:hypothetical protein